MWPFFYFQYGFRFSRSTADLLTVVSVRIATGLGLLELWHLIYSRLLTGLGMLFFFTNLRLMESQVIFGLISSFLSNKWFRVVLNGKSSQEHPVNTGLPQGSILGPTIFVLYINDLPEVVICDIAICADHTVTHRHLTCDSN